jgi:16S rRNA (guanine527-N7)-methyltransferase
LELIKKYFPDLTPKQLKQLEDMEALYADWNSKINLISRKDFENFYERHVLHSMAIAKYISFKEGTTVMDVGTGGGFPGIPLAILFPRTRFTLVDSVGKKIKVVTDVAEKLGLGNVRPLVERAEKVEGEFDFIVSRAVTELPEFYGWVRNKLRGQNRHTLKNGILYLKGGDLTEELVAFKAAKPRSRSQVFHLSEHFSEPFFETKNLIHIYTP